MIRIKMQCNANTNVFIWLMDVAIACKMSDQIIVDTAMYLSFGRASDYDVDLIKLFILVNQDRGFIVCCFEWFSFASGL